MLAIPIIPILGWLRLRLLELKASRLGSRSQWIAFQLPLLIATRLIETWVAQYGQQLMALSTIGFYYLLIRKWLQGRFIACALNQPLPILLVIYSKIYVSILLYTRSPQRAIDR